MSFKNFLSAAVVAALLPLAAQAQQFQAGAGVFDGNGYGSSYTGAGGFTPLFNQALGQVVDGGNGAFDAFGFYNAGVGSLGQQRQVELLAGNVFRFFDTFTNTGSSTVSTTLNFFGNLGSDGDELVSHVSAGLVVSCEDDGFGACGSDPVLALVSGNNGLGQAAITPDRYNVRFEVSLAPGQSLSLLNYAFLASEVNGPTAADLDLALATGQQLQASPWLQGLSRQQIDGIANFNLSPVPEPSTWAMALLGMGLLGWKLRRRG
ncbi:PEP-CTERM sorting domain-containing protein [Aquincola tertiaricarbonis]|uniref:PEP-CTERM sorting domain-containing protein n=1 Tax=Aquincola tertiaricarbonis TaxID=391953 RepID=UPI0018DBF6A6|nr:PEP-CTERM sorting domain-containing protein [Aquincola tertiaricarbonis]